jgi:hypothetical protein
MLGKYLSTEVFTLLLLSTVAGTSLGVIYQWGDYFQSQHQLAIEREATPMLKVGQAAPPILRLAKLPATPVFFPPCSQCSVESPSGLAGMRFNKSVTVVLVDSPKAWPGREARRSGLRVSHVGDEAVKWFALKAAPRVVCVDASGRISYIRRGMFQSLI